MGGECAPLCTCVLLDGESRKSTVVRRHAGEDFRGYLLILQRPGSADVSGPSLEQSLAAASWEQLQLSQARVGRDSEDMWCSLQRVGSGVASGPSL